MNLSEFSQSITNDILRLIHQANEKASRYHSFTLDYSDPILFELTVNIKVTQKLNPATDQYFKDVLSEIIRFKKFGFAIDGESFGGDSTDGPEIGISVAVDPSQIKSRALESKLLDVIRHELEHLLQRGDNFSPEHRVKIPRVSTRNRAKSNYTYFTLSDEIPAQVRGLAEEARLSGESVQQCAIKYLTPFLELGFITGEQMDKVLSAWAKWAAQHNIKFT